MVKKILKVLLFAALIPFLGSLPFLLFSLFGLPIWTALPGVPLLVLLILRLFRKRLDLGSGFRVYGVVLLALAVLFTVMMCFTGGNVEGLVMQQFCWAILPFAPVILIALLTSGAAAAFATAFLTYAAAAVFCFLCAETRPKKVLVPALAFLLCLSLSLFLYWNRPSVKYRGHGFDYMHGYSSTDFTDYTVYAEHSKLVTLAEAPGLVIEREEDMPVLDGAEACYPLYAAFAKAVYRDIDRIEREAPERESWQNGRIVTFTNTIAGFRRLVSRDLGRERVDMFFGAYPSEEQLESAREAGVELEITPIGREGFVFFVEEDNPVEGLTSDEIRAIYHGDIENWQELGGKNQKIAAFQRPQNSGSQTRMIRFMGDVSLKEPKTYEVVDAMSGVIREVAQYANEAGAMGYSFRYFLEELGQEKGVKMLAVDGVYPSVENIESGSYPLTGSLCLITRKGDPNPNVQKMKDFILSEQGQEIIRRTGYAPLRPAE